MAAEDTTLDPAEDQNLDSNDTLNDENDDTVNDDDQQVEAAESGDADATTGDTAEVQAAGEDEDANDPVLNYKSPQYQTPLIDFSQLQTDAEGNVDPNAFAQAMGQMQAATLAQARAQARDEMMQVRQEEKLWQQAEKKYPALAGNRELRDLVQTTRYGVIASGKNATPLDAAGIIFKHVTSAQVAGRAQAKESVRVQRSGALETSSTHAAPKSSKTDLMSKITSRDKQTAEAARQALLESWIEEGTIRTR